MKDSNAEVTYRQFLDDLDADTRQLCLPWVQICCFTAQVPAGFELFQGRLAALGIDRLCLEPSQTEHLLEAVGDTGVGVPGTPYGLQVVRPFHAHFIQKPAEAISLPVDWLAGLELWDQTQRVWIGSYVREAPICPAPLINAAQQQLKACLEFESLDWNRFQESRWGWREKNAPELPQTLSSVNYSRPDCFKKALRRRP